MVKDELDVLPEVLDHLLAQGIDQILVADNLSTDGTREYLRERSEHEPRLLLALDQEPAYFQAAKMSWLAHCAWRSGADWVVPFDGDEFWFARDASVGDFLRNSPVNVVHASFHHMVPLSPAPSPLAQAEFILDSHPSWPGKVAVRTHPFATIVRGNHAANRVGRTSNGLFIAHAQYRSPVQVARKVRQGTAAARLTGGDVGVLTPHWAQAEGLDSAEVAQVWENISHGRPDERIQFKAVGPMVTVRPLRWTTWDPDGQVPLQSQHHASTPENPAESPDHD